MHAHVFFMYVDGHTPVHVLVCECGGPCWHHSPLIQWGRISDLSPEIICFANLASHLVPEIPVSTSQVCEVSGGLPSLLGICVGFRIQPSYFHGTYFICWAIWLTHNVTFLKWQNYRMEIRLMVTKNYAVQGQRAVRAVKGNLGDPCTFENRYHDYVIVNVLCDVIVL